MEAIIKTSESLREYDDMCHRAMMAYQGLLELKQYSPNTIRNYKHSFGYFLRGFPGLKPSTITKPMIMDWMLKEMKKNN